MSTCILVVGIHRSGTSAAAGVLFHLGVPMGKEFLPPMHQNPKGFFEDLKLMRIQDAMIGDWRNPSPRGLHPNYVQAIRERSKQPLWGFKYPRTCYTLPIFCEVFQGKVKILHIVRPREDVILSLATRDLTMESATRVHDIYDINKKKNLEKAEKQGIPILTIRYDDMVDDSVRIVDTIRKFVYPDGRDINMETAINFIDPLLRRSRA